jgi:DMSO/TMAO reductase YedYZ molybdopterin-dependent catalytic subunit
VHRSTDRTFGEPGRVTPEELQLAARNHGLPLEALRYPLTPVGLHYLLTHYDIPHVDEATWALEIGGRVAGPLRLDLDELRSRPRVSVTVTMECAGNGRALLDPRPLSQPWLHEAVGTAVWTGVSLRSLLDEIGVDDHAVELVFTGLDRGVEAGTEQNFERALVLDEACRPDVVLAYEMNGQPLLPQHGAPLRLVVPGWYGMTNVKWLSRITAVSEPFAGYQNERSYRLLIDADDRGTPMSRMRPRALMVPPGIPDFYTRRRVLGPGPTTLAGRAWSGGSPVSSVEVSVDGGETWADAVVDAQQLGPWAWQSWTYDWGSPRPGDHIVCCRARDAAGNAQEDFPAWNVGGYANPAPHQLFVTVAE